MKLTITKEIFCETIENLRKQDKIDRTLSGAMEVAFLDSFVSVYNYSLIRDSLLKLISTTFNDESDWIGYFMYELEYGVKWKKGMVTSEGIDVRLSTASDLYNLLIK